MSFAYILSFLVLTSHAVWISYGSSLLLRSGFSNCCTCKFGVECTVYFQSKAMLFSAQDIICGLWQIWLILADVHEWQWMDKDRGNVEAASSACVEILSEQFLGQGLKNLSMYLFLCADYHEQDNWRFYLLDKVQWKKYNVSLIIAKDGQGLRECRSGFVIVCRGS